MFVLRPFVSDLQEISACS